MDTELTRVRHEPVAEVRPAAGRADLPAPRVVTALVVGGHALGELIRPAVDSVVVRQPAELVGGDGAGVNLVVLTTPDTVTDLAALAVLPRPRPPVLAVTPAIGPGEVLTVLRSGVRSILVDGQYTRSDLLDAVRATAAGHSRLSPGPLAAVVDHLQAGFGVEPARPVLTPRELDIMRLLVTGEANPAIARRLALAEKTVRNSVSQIYLKLGVSGRGEAVVWWMSRVDPG
jgi:DNA-binding NarL/FixJ family response regulator